MTEIIRQRVRIRWVKPRQRARSRIGKLTGDKTRKAAIHAGLEDLVRLEGFFR